MTEQFNSKLEKYRALQARISQSIEQVVNQELLQKNQDNVIQTLDRIDSIRNSFQTDFRNLTVDLHRDLLSHFESFNPADSSFNELHEKYVRFLEKINERHQFMSSECDELVVQIQELYKSKIEALKETERKLAEAHQAQHQLQHSNSQPVQSTAEEENDSPSTPTPKGERNFNSDQLSQSVSSQSKAGLLGKMKNIFGNKKVENGEAPAVEMKLGEQSNFKWDPIKKRYVFEGDEDKEEEEAPMPPKKLSESTNLAKKEKEEPQAEKAQLAVSDMLKPHTSNLGFMKRKQAGAKTNQPTGAKAPLNVFKPMASVAQEPINQNYGSVSEEKPLCIKLFSEFEALVSGLSISSISSTSYVQPLNEIIALAQEDATQLHKHESEIEAIRRETDQIGQAVKTYEMLTKYKEEIIKKLMENERQTNGKLFTLQSENESLKTTLGLYKDLFQSGNGSKEDSKTQYQSTMQEGHFESLMNELTMKEKVVQLTDELNTLRLREAEAQARVKASEELADLYKKHAEQREAEQGELQELFNERFEKDEVALRLVNRAYELGQRLEGRGKKIQALNKLCKQISNEVGEKNHQISDLFNKIKRTEKRVEESESIIQARDEKIHELENELTQAVKDRKLISSLQNENSGMHKSIETSKREMLSLSTNLNDVMKQAKTHQGTIDQLKSALEVQKRENDEHLKDLAVQQSLNKTVSKLWGRNIVAIATTLNVEVDQDLSDSPLNEETFKKVVQVLHTIDERVHKILRESNGQSEVRSREVESLRASLAQEKEFSAQTQESLKNQIETIYKELELEKDRAADFDGQLRDAKKDAEQAQNRYSDLLKRNLELEGKNQELLESVSTNLKQQLRFSLKNKLIRDAYSRNQQTCQSLAQKIEELHQSYQSLRKAHDDTTDAYSGLSNTHRSLEDKNQELQRSNEALHSEIQKLRDEHQRATERDNEKVSEERLKEALDMYESEKSNAEALHNQLKSVLLDRDSTNTTHENIKSALEDQVHLLHSESVSLKQEITSLKSALEESSAKLSQTVADSESLRKQIDDSKAASKFVEENHEKQQNAINVIQAEHDKLKIEYGRLLDNSSSVQLPEHVASMIATYYRDLISDDLSENEGEMIVRLLEQIDQSKSGDFNARDRESQVQSLKDQLESIQQENQRLIETVTVLEESRNESEDYNNLKMLYEKKTKRVDELNKDLEEKNRELDKLRGKAVHITGDSSKNDTPAIEDLRQEIERLNKENVTIKEDNKKKTDDVENHSDNISIMEQKLKLMKEELDILKLSHSEELETLTKEISQKEATEKLLRKQLLEVKNTEPVIQFGGAKVLADAKSPGVATNITSPPPQPKYSEEPVIIGKKPAQEVSSEKAVAGEPRKDEEVRKSQTGGFFSNMANFFLTDKERKELIE